MDTPSLPPRVVWHTTESGAGSAAFDDVAAYLSNINAEPHILYDPTTDRIGQYGPLDESARALKNDDSSRTNRTGSVCIQIEVLARASNPFTNYWRPGPNWRALMAAIRSWDVPDTWPMGPPAATAAAAHNRNRSTWLNRGGHYGHCHVPGNDHWDPGAINTAALFDAAGGGGHGKPTNRTWIVRAGQTMAAIAVAAGVSLASLIGANPQVKNPSHILPGQELHLPQGARPSQPDNPKPPPTHDNTGLGTYQVTINGLAYGPGAYGTHITTLGQALVRRGLGSYYAVGPGPRWTTADTRAYAAYQRSLGYRGASADGIPGPATLRALIGTTSASTYPGRSAVRYGTKGPQVLQVDQALIRHGYGHYLTYGPSSYYGKTTRAGVKAFQENQGWRGTDADGNVGPVTWRRLMR
ncbi:peptidoglycan-binding protein [Streptomyces sp. NRRL F-4489]|uniref:peptidoglycan-binding protein n=1 Tax=Streptomyces sp. NRRL F-4489 TaxID=1609095 RepID=UPI001F1F2B9A|nr:peptidoglycan-binding protein [Streptomyces sp. NRRL F-4489]